MRNISSNIWKYTLLLISNKRVFAPIMTAYYLSVNGVDTKGIALILLMGSVSGFLFEIPSGYISDKIGHRNALILSRVIMLTSSILFLIAGNLSLLILASIFMSLAFAFTSGTGPAFLHDTLEQLDRETEYAKVSGRVKALSFGVPLLFSSFIPLLMGINYKAPFILGLVIDIVGLLASLSMVSPKIYSHEVKEITIDNFKGIIKEGKLLGFNKLAVLSGVIHGATMAFGMYRAAYQEYLLVPIIYFGLFFGMGRLLATILLTLSSQIKQKLTINQFYALQIFIYTTITLSLGFTNNPWIVVGIFMLHNGLKWGLNQTDTAFLIEKIKDSQNKATLLSVKAQIGIATTGIAGYLLGNLILWIDYMNTFLIFGLLSLAISLVLYFNTFRKNYDR